MTFVDDYAHLPTEVRAALAAARAGGWRADGGGLPAPPLHPDRRAGRGFADAFVDADVVVVTDVYSAGEPPVPGVSGQLVADAGRPPRPGAAGASTRPAARSCAAAVAGLLRPGDLCCTLGAGDLTTLPDELLAGPAW